VYGKVAGIGLAIRQPMDLINDVVKVINERMLQFLLNRQPGDMATNSLLEIEKFN